jgi:hypothetical protein
VNSASACQREVPSPLTASNSPRRSSSEGHLQKGVSLSGQMQPRPLLKWHCVELSATGQGPLPPARSYLQAQRRVMERVSADSECGGRRDIMMPGVGGRKCN